MRYREIQPRNELASFIECFWTLEDDGSMRSGGPESILPDGCVELILNLGERFNEHRENGREERQPQHFLVGQMTRPILIAPTGSVSLIGIRFQPGGAFPFLRFDMSEVTDTVVELGCLDATLERDLDAIASAGRSLAVKVAAVEEHLVRRTRWFEERGRMNALTDAIVRTGGILPVDRLAKDAGLSGRQLQRRFLKEVGIGPKLLSRILRFQQVFRAVEHNRQDWAQLAVDCGYYDQAHLIRDCQAFARQTPAALLTQASPLTESFLRKNRMSHFSNTLQ